MKKTIVLVLLALLVIGIAWFIFHDQPEGYVNTEDSPSAVSASSYKNQAFGFAVTVPAGFTVDEAYLNQDLGPGREIPGVAFRVPVLWSEGTNLASDSHLAVEELSDVDCVPENFLDSPTIESRAVPGKNTFTVAKATGVGAGNIYDETVYITEKDNRCYAVRSVVHTGNIANYPTGTVKEFDQKPFRAAFDALAESLVL